MKLILIRTVSILLVGIGLLFGLPTVTQSASQPVKVELGGTGATSWAINNLTPGNSGNRIVSLTDSGTSDGKADIWISNITGNEGTPSQLGIHPLHPNTNPAANRGDLQNNLFLNLTGSGLNADFAMPALLKNFPQSASGVHHLTINRLSPGQSINLTWDWNLPYTTGNEVQGDSVSFDINYSLTEIPAPAPEPAPAPGPTSPGTNTRIIGLDVPAASTSSGITNDGIVTGVLAATTPDSNFTLDIYQGTQLALSNDNRQNPVDLSKVGDTIPARIVVTNPDMDTIPPLPEGWIPVSPPYDINGVTNGYITGVKMDKPATMIIKFDEKLLPQIVENIALFYYDYVADWTQLQPPSGIIAERPNGLAADEVAAEVNHFSLFIVLAKPGKAGPPPANIAIQKLTLDPPRILVGQSSDVRVKVTNKGGMAGEYIVVVKVAGKVQKTQLVKLGAGETTEVDLILTPGLSGIYTVMAGPASDNLVVDPRIAPDVAETNYWWLLCIALGFSTLVFTLFRRRHKAQPADNRESPPDQ